MENWKWWYYRESREPSFHPTFTKYFKVKVNKVTGEEIDSPIRISYEEFFNR